VVLTRERHRHKVDITLHARGERFLHGVGSSTTWEAGVADAVTRLGQQAQKLKGKYQSRKRQGAVKDVSAAEAEASGVAPQAVDVKPVSPQVDRRRARMPRILRATRQTVRSMSVADAAREFAGNGDGIVIFLDAETASISVLYRRSDGEVTLVQTET
jgi:hypothetical protein